jgi:phage shock protein A
MSYFSRLTDIVTCNLSDLLARESDPQDALRRIIREMEEGVAGAKRSVANAAAAAERLGVEMNGHRTQVAYWSAKAREELSQHDDDAARGALMRKKEIEDLVAALQQQQAAAISTRDHLDTTRRALEVRLAEAHRKQQEYSQSTALQSDTSKLGTDTPAAGRLEKGSAQRDLETQLDQARAAQIEAELEALRRELGQIDA